MQQFSHPRISRAAVRDGIVGFKTSAGMTFCLTCSTSTFLTMQCEDNVYSGSKIRREGKSVGTE